MTTAVTGLLCWRDFHPQEWQLASLHQIRAGQVRALGSYLGCLIAQLEALQQQIDKLECQIHAQHRASEASRWLETIPGIGVIGATAIAAAVTDPKAFRSGREFAAWIGLVPRQTSSGGKERLGSISKQGDR